MISTMVSMSWSLFVGGGEEANLKNFSEKFTKLHLWEVIHTYLQKFWSLQFQFTPPKFNITPEKWWLEDCFIYFPMLNFLGLLLNFVGVVAGSQKPPKLPMPQSIEPIHPVQHQRSLSRFYRSPSSMLQSSWKHFFCSAGKNIKRKHDHIALHAVIWEISLPNLFWNLMITQPPVGAKFRHECGWDVFAFSRPRCRNSEWDFRRFWREQKGEVFFLLKKWCKKAVVSIKTLRTWI